MMKPVVTTLFIVLTLNELKAQEPALDPSKLKRGDLDANMQLLNLWETRPEWSKRLYESAYKILASKKDATFADVADDATIQRLCNENHVTHFGGPMLGAVGPTDVRVWLRTCRPAKVEVRVTVDRHERTYGPVESTRESDLVAIVAVTDLGPGQRYPYQVSCTASQGNTLSASSPSTARFQIRRLPSG